MDIQYQNFSQLSLTWKTLIVIGSISTFVFFILLVIIVSLMFESKTVKKDQDILSEYDDFLNEFTNGKNENKISFIEDSKYPSLPKIKDFDGNFLKDLMHIDII